MAFILVALIPFAVFMSAIMIAVCSFARTFKEAQNYVTPVILAVLVPGGIAAFPATRLEGVMLVLPVGNMVALAKELLLGAAVPVWQMAIVIVSTSLYAAAAIAAAANIFGKESVVFADAGSWRGTFARAPAGRGSTESVAGAAVGRGVVSDLVLRAIDAFTGARSRRPGIALGLCRGHAGVVRAAAGVAAGLPQSAHRRGGSRFGWRRRRTSWVRR